MENNQEKRKLLNSLAKYSGMGVQIGLTIYAGHFVGALLDEKYANEDELYSKVITLLAVFLAMYSVIRQVTRDANKEH